MPAATRTTRMLQASTAHADFKHACTYLPFLPRAIQRPNAAGPDAKNGPIGRKGLKLAAPPAGRHARSPPRRHDAPAAATPVRDSAIRAAAIPPCAPPQLFPPAPLPEPLTPFALFGTPPGTAGNPEGIGADGNGAPPPPDPADNLGSQDPPAPLPGTETPVRFAVAPAAGSDPATPGTPAPETGAGAPAAVNTVPVSGATTFVTVPVSGATTPVTVPVAAPPRS